jgi:hypothetical protein
MKGEKMAVEQITVVCVEIEDKPGSLQNLLAKIASAKVDLLCFAAYSAGGGRGRVYLSGKDPKALESYAQTAGIKTSSAAGFIIGGGDEVGAAGRALKGLAEAGINGVAGAAMVCDGQYHMLLIVKAADGDAAAKALGA